jgi:hypothetical protein
MKLQVAAAADTASPGGGSLRRSTTSLWRLDADERAADHPIGKPSQI